MSARDRASRRFWPGSRVKDDAAILDDPPYGEAVLEAALGVAVHRTDRRRHRMARSPQRGGTARRDEDDRLFESSEQDGSLERRL